MKVRVSGNFFKKHGVPLLLLGEIVVFCWYAVSGSHGWYAMQALRTTTQTLQKKIVSMTAEIKVLQEEIADWKSFPLYQEQYAREQLQMSAPDDEVYLL